MQNKAFRGTITSLLYLYLLLSFAEKDLRERAKAEAQIFSDLGSFFLKKISINYTYFSLKCALTYENRRWKVWSYYQ